MIRFAFLYVMSLYVLSLYPFCRFTFCHYLFCLLLFFVVIRFVIIRSVLFRRFVIIRFVTESSKLLLEGGIMSSKYWKQNHKRSTKFPAGHAEFLFLLLTT
jgi:hypothetical protein